MTSLRFPYTRITRHNVENPLLDLVVFTDYKKLTLKKSITIPTKIGFLEKDFGFGAILGVYGFLDHFAFYANVPHHYFELNPIFDTP